MLDLLDEFREKLDDVMCRCLHRQIIVYGNNRSASCLRWYAKYYHNIDIDYRISLEDYPTSEHYWEPEIFQKQLFEFDYRGVRDAVVWLSVPIDDEIRSLLEYNGYVKDETYFDFYERVYGSKENYIAVSDGSEITPRKEGLRDIQYLDFLEWKYGCNFLQTVYKDSFEKEGPGAGFVATSHRELCPALDLVHPSWNEGIFDFGCGKGNTLVSFIDYGFQRVGGVEYEPSLFRTMRDNIDRLGIDDRFEIEMIQGDARDVKEELDKYSLFYFFDPFPPEIVLECIDNIAESAKRKPRKVRVMYLNPYAHTGIEERGFRLSAQVQVETRNRVISIFESSLD